jgi:hypothetical protein
MGRKKRMRQEHWKALKRYLSGNVDLICETLEEREAFLYILDHTVGEGRLDARINVADLEAHVTRRLQKQKGSARSDS